MTTNFPAVSGQSKFRVGFCVSVREDQNYIGTGEKNFYMVRTLVCLSRNAWLGDHILVAIQYLPLDCPIRLDL